MASQLETIPVVTEAPAPQQRITAAAPASTTRIASLDQFRGYTVLGMFFVNFVGGLAVIHDVFKHHNTYCSYADTIMPQFFFAVGFAYRLTLVRRLQTVGPWTAYGHALKRNLGLLLLGFVVHNLDGAYSNWAELERLGIRGFFQTAFQREFFQTLTHIAVTSIWIMPVIAAPAWVRIGFACFSGVLFVVLSHLFYYDWVMHRPGIDGGPLGFLTWTIPMIVGTLAYDAVAPCFAPALTGTGPQAGSMPCLGKAGIRLAGWSVLIMALGYGISCVNLVTPPNNVSEPTGQPNGQEARALTSYLVEPPFVSPTGPVNIWTMSQRAGSVAYLTFGAGFSLAVYVFFLLACDIGRLRLGVFGTLGTNALAGYILHLMVMHAIKPYMPRDCPAWYAWSMIALFMGITYLFLRYLEKNRIFLKL